MSDSDVLMSLANEVSELKSLVRAMVGEVPRGVAGRVAIWETAERIRSNSLLNYTANYLTSGRARVGTHPTHTGYAGLWDSSNNGGGNHGIITNGTHTTVNAGSGGTISFAHNNAATATFTASLLDIVPGTRIRGIIYVGVNNNQIYEQSNGITATNGQFAATNMRSDSYSSSGNSLMLSQSGGWVRLNNNSSFANGVYTPGVMRVDGNLLNLSPSQFGRTSIQNSAWMMGIDGAGTTSGTFALVVRNNTPSNLMYLRNDAYLWAAVNWAIGSSRKRKRNIKDLSAANAIATLMKLRPREYEVRNSNRKAFGFIAEETEEHIPSVVCDGDPSNPEDKAIVYGDFIAPLVATVQHLLHNLKASNEKIAELESRLAALEAAL